MVFSLTPPIPPAALNCSVSSFAALTAAASWGAAAPDMKWTTAIFSCDGLSAASPDAGAHAIATATMAVSAVATHTFVLRTIEFW